MTTSPGAVVLVHGIWMGGWAMRWLAGRLAQQGYRSECFSYPSLGRTLDENAAGLVEYLQEWPREGSVHLLGHSLGGLVVLTALAAGGSSLPPGKVLLLGTPLRGSAVARHLSASRHGRWLVGRARDSQLCSGIQALPDGRPVAQIAGTRKLGIGLLLGAEAGAGDGTVSVAETRLPGVQHALCPQTHTGLLLSDEVARLALAYFETGTLGGAKSS